MNFGRLSNNGSRAHIYNWQKRGLRNGDALRGHIKTAHGGIAVATCPACQEIQRKMRLAVDADKPKEVYA